MYYLYFAVLLIMTKFVGTEHNYGHSDIHIYFLKNESSRRLRRKYCRVSALKCLFYSPQLSSESSFPPLHCWIVLYFSLSGGPVFCHTVNGSPWQPPTHRDGHLDPARLTKSPSCSCRGCSRSACLLCQTCGGCCRRTLCQTAETDGGEDDGGQDCEKDTNGLQTDAGVYHVSCDRAFPSMKYKAAGQRAAEGCCTSDPDHKRCHMSAVGLLSGERLRKVKNHSLPRSRSSGLRNVDIWMEHRCKISIN